MKFFGINMIFNSVFHPVILSNNSVKSYMAYFTGSVSPASLKPFNLSLHESHWPHGLPSVVGS